MYIWFAIDINDQVLNLRKGAENYANANQLVSPTFTLPFHISLKISCEIADELYHSIVNDVRDLYKDLGPLEIEVKKLEQCGNIIWLTMQDNFMLRCLHNLLDLLFLDKYDIDQHEFDKDFIFHTSVLILDNEKHLQSAFNEISNITLPTTLIANKIIIGSSLTGKAGTYTVNEEILL